MEGSSNLGLQKSDNSRGSESLRSQHVGRIGLPGDPSDGSMNVKESEKAGLALGNNVYPRNKVGLFGMREGDYGRSAEWGDVSLRWWLDRPGRSVNSSECFYIFRQIVEIVHMAHSQGIALHNVRPSCFIMSPFNYVSFIESASCSDSGSDDGFNNQIVEAKKLSTPFPLHMLQQRNRHGPVISPINASSGSSQRKSSALAAARLSLVEESEANKIHEKEKENVEAEEKNQTFPMKKILAMESTWYSSPEELAGAPGSCASDIYRLGVLIFELYCPVGSWEKKCETMSSLRHRVLDTQLLQMWPNEASFCMLLMHPDPTGRPTASDILHSNYLIASKDNLEERDAAVELKERVEQHELLEEFFQLLQLKKQEFANRIQRSLSYVCSDIEEVINQRAYHMKNMAPCPELEKDDCSFSNIPTINVADDDESVSLSSRKRLRIGPQINSMEECGDNLNDEKNSDSQHDNATLSRTSRMMKNFNKLELAYLLTRFKANKPLKKPSLRTSSTSSGGRGSGVVTERSSVNNLTSKYQNEEGRKSGWINPFLEDFCKYLSLTQLKVKAELKQGDLLNSTNLVCSLGFDRDGEYFASAGVNKKIKVFDYNTIINEDRDIHYPMVEMVSKSKLSSICWNSYIKSHIASSNFEGVVQVWDATTGQVVTKMEEHERRVWSIDFSSVDPTLLASGSDDGSVKLWNINQAATIGTIKTKANVCCVQFPPDSGRSLAFGSADHMIYYYDLRSAKSPLYTFCGHDKTVSYIKFVDATNFVSSSTDNTIRLWDLSACISQLIDAPAQTFTGHTNVKNFVGLSVADGFIATGSETNEAFVYHKAFPMPALSFKFSSTDPLSGHELDDTSHFVSSVCWRAQSSTLLAANSMGNIKIFEMV